MKCVNCGTHNQPFKNGRERKRCWYCKQTLENGSLLDETELHPAGKLIVVDSNIEQWKENLPQWAKDEMNKLNDDMKKQAQENGLSEERAMTAIRKRDEKTWKRFNKK